MNSEIFGLPTEKPWGFYFERLPLEIASVPHHPTQIYESAFYFLCFGIMAWLFFKKKAQQKPWLMFGVLLILIFGFRIIVEFWKEDQEGQQATAFFNLGQLLSIPFILGGILLVLNSLKRKKI
jgi:prolipoprotein diacylglyceryltransferase